MFGLPMNYVLAIVLGVVGVGWTFRAWIPGLFSGAMALVKRTPSAAKPDRKAALDSVDDVIAYLEAIGCPEGVEHFKAGLAHLYHKHGGV